MALPRITSSTVIKLVIASLCVGIALAYLDMDPMDLFDWARRTVADVMGDAAGWIQWAIKYVFLGAVVVVPIWLVHYLWRMVRGKP